MKAAPEVCVWKRSLVLSRGWLAALAGWLSLAGLECRAQEEVWIDPTGGTGAWSLGTNWLDGTAPAGAGSTSLTLRFATSIGTTAVSNHDLNDVFQVNRLSFEQPLGRALTLSAASGRSISFSGTGARITQAGTGAISITAPVVLKPADNVVTIDGGGLGNLTISGPLSGLGSTQTLRINPIATSPNGAVVTLSGVNTISGTVALSAGNLAIGQSALGSAKLRVQGGTVRFITPDSIISSPVELESDLVVSGSNTASLAGQLSSITPGTGISLRTGTSNSTLQLTAASPYSGATIVDFGLTSHTPYADAGILRIAENGSILNTSAIEIRAGGTLAIDTLESGTTNRVADNLPINLRGGRLLIEAVNSGASAQIEKVGPVNISGFASISAGPTERDVDLVAASLTRVQRGTVLFRSPTMGGSTAAGARIVFTTAPTGLVGGGGTGANQSILPYGIGDEMENGAGTGLVTYGGAGGVRLLDVATEYAATLPAAAATNNVRLTEPAILAGDTTVNALVLTGGAHLVSGSGTLSVASGTIISNPSNHSASQITVPLAFGAAEAQIFAIKDLFVSGLSGSGGLTKSGSGTLYLFGTNTFSGPLTVNAGLVGFSQIAQLGTDTGALRLNGVGAGLTYIGATARSFTRSLEIATGFGAVESSNSSGTLVMDAPITGGGGLRVGAGGLGTVRLNIANSHTGPTVVSSGTLEFADDAVFGSGEVWIGGNLRLLAPWTTSRTIHIPGSGGNPNNVDLRQNVDTNGFDAVWNGSLSGVAALTKSGAGTLAVTRPVPFLGSITVNGGTMVLRGNGAIQSDRVTVASGGVFQLDGTGATGPRVKSSLAATLTGGEIRLVGDATNAVREDLGSLRVVPASLGSNIALVTPGSGSVTLQISTLSRQNAELLVRANSLGGASGTAFQRLRFTTLLGARDGINPGIYTTPGGMGGESLTTDNANSDAAGVIGLQSLAPSYVATTLLQNPATPPTTNALIQPGATTAGSSNTVRSLTFESGGTLSQSASQTLTLSSGQVLVRSGAGPATLSGGTLAFGSQGGTVGLFGDLVLDAAVSGSAGWTKIGPGVLTLGIQPAGAAALTIGSGPVRVSSPTALAHQVVPFGGLRALLDLAGNDTTVGGLSGTGSVNLGGATLTLGSTGAFFQASPTFLGPGQVRIEDGGERIQLRILNVRSAPGGAAVTLASGRFSYHDSNAINPTPLTLAGGVLEIPSGFRVPLILTGAARIGSSGSIAAPATITGPGSLHLEGPDTVTLEVGARHSGETILSGSGSPTLNLTGADGALHTTSAIRLIESGRLVVNYGTSSSERLNDAAPIYLNGGRLIGFAPWNNTAVERIGRLVAGSRGEIELLPNTQFSTTSVLALRPAEIVRENHGTLRIFAHRLASVEMGHHVQIHPAAVPELIGGGAASGPGQSIVPWIVATPNAANATVTFTTHDPIRGLRPLDPSTEFAQGLAGVGAASDNLRLSGTQTLASPLTVNSLLLSEHVSQPALNGPASLAITSGAVLMDASTATIAAPLNFGTQEALFHVHKGYLSVSGQISGAGGLTKSGSQTLALSGDNVLSGAVRLLDGTLAITKPQALGTGGDALHFDGGALHYNGTGPATITRSILLGSDGGRISNGDTAATLTISGSISGSGAINLGGEGAILLTGTSDYTGKTTISTSVKFNSDSALGQSTHLHFDADELEPTFDWVTSRDLHLSGNATISTGTFDVTLNGRLFGEKLTKRGTGTLTLRDADEFSGGISVRQGAVVIEGALAGNPLGESLVFIERGTAVGNGTWERSIHSFGTLSPGPGIGTISARDVTLVSSPDPLENATLALDILSASEFDRLVVRGTFALEGSVELELTLGYNPRDGMDSFLVVDNNGTDPITGASPHLFRFNGNDLDERESFFVNGQQMQLSYFGGDGNDVVLYATPEPTTPAMLIASFALFGCGRRRPASPAR